MVSPIDEVAGVKKMLHNETVLRKAAEAKVNNLRNQIMQLKRSEVCFHTSVTLCVCVCLVDDT